MLTNIKVTIKNNGSEIIKQSENKVTDSLSNLISQLKVIRATVNVLLTDMIEDVAGNNSTRNDTEFCEDDGESEDDEEENNDVEKILNGKKKLNLKRLPEDQEKFSKKVKQYFKQS